MKKLETQNGYKNCSISHHWQVAESGLEPLNLSWSLARVITTTLSHYSIFNLNRCPQTAWSTSQTWVPTLPNGGPYLEWAESSSRGVSACLQTSPCGSTPAADYSKLCCGSLSFCQEGKVLSWFSELYTPVTNGCETSEHRIKLKIHW